MEWVEVTGKTVDAAKEAALDQLGVAEGDAEVIVVSEPKSGLFGRLRGEARVRARVRPVGPRPKRQRRAPRDRDRDRDRTRSAGAGRRGAEQRNGRQDGGRNGRSQHVRAGDGGSDADDPAAAEGRSSGQGRSRSARRRRSRSGDRAATPAAVAVAADEERGGGQRSDRHGGSAEEAKEGVGMAEGMTLEEQAAVAKEFLEGLLDRFGFQAAVGTRVLDEETVELAADGDDLGVLIGPKGATLAALQDVTRTVVQRRFPTRTDRILVDVAGYRERRAAALQRFSQQVAAEVVESGAERALEPMSPADRKVVHDTVNEIVGVATRSEGEDPARYVVISPAG